MCAVSMMFDYGRSLPKSFWNEPSLKCFKRLLGEAKKFDEETNQPDCEDPSKAEWMKDIEEKVDIDMRCDCNCGGCGS